MPILFDQNRTSNIFSGPINSDIKCEIQEIEDKLKGLLKKIKRSKKEINRIIEEKPETKF